MLTDMPVKGEVSQRKHDFATTDKHVHKRPVAFKLVLNGIGEDLRGE